MKTFTERKNRKFPDNSNDLLTHILGNTNKNEILKFLHNNHGQLEIRHEINKSSTSTINNERTISYIISSKNINPGFNELNGVVIDANNTRILSYPLPIFKQIGNSVDFSDMDVYELKDMTSITLYFNPSNGRWRISTSKAYDMVNIAFIKKTYAEIFYELVTELCPDFVTYSGIALIKDPRGKFILEFNNLTSTYCYSFLIRHECLQPISSLGGKDILLIRIVDLSNPNNLPTIVPSETYSMYGIPMQKPIVDFKFTEIGPIRESNCFQNSLANAQDRNRQKINYGYIFIPKDQTINSNYYILQSPLFEFMRRNIYYKFENCNITCDNRFLFIQLRAYLSPHKDEVLKLEPEWKSKFNEFDTFVEDLRNQTVGLYRETKILSKPIHSNLKLKFAKFLIDEISKN